MATMTISNTDSAAKYYRWVLWLVGLGLFNQSAPAQSLGNHYQARSDSAGGYWMVHTQPDSRSTDIHFFGP